MSDPLFSVRNSFYLGAYNQVINEAADLDLSDVQGIERDCLVYRSYLALGSHELVLSEIRDTSATSLQAVKLLAQYRSGKGPGKDGILSTLSEWLADAACNRNPTVLLVAGIIYLHEGSTVEALQACHSGATLELQALCVQCYLKLDRLDKAEQALKVMCTTDDDATLTQLATAWYGLAMGGTKVQEASYIFQELGDKYNWTALLYNCRALCHMKAGEWEEAERDLLDALSKDAKDPDTLANLITVGLHLAKSTARYASQLKVIAPTHPIVQRMAAGDDAFSRAAAAMA